MLAVFIVGFLLAMTAKVEGKFMSLQCIILDNDYAEFPICKIQPINRYRNSIKVHYRQKQAVDEAIVRMETYRKVNGWRPYLYNTSIRACDLVQKNKNFVLSRLFLNLKPYLTLKDACPWKVNGTVQCENFEFDWDSMHTRFPLEKGEYAARFTLHYRNSVKLYINCSVDYSNYKDIAQSSKSG